MGAETVALDVEKLKRGLEDLPEPVANPVLIIISGLPGTGKSYLSRGLAQQLASVILESDALRKRLCHTVTYSARESHRLFNTCHSLIEELLRKGISVIFDATNLVEQHRERLYRISQRLNVKLIIVSVEAPRDVTLQRLKSRSQGIDTEDNSDADSRVYYGMRAKAERIRRNHFVVDTSRDIAPAIDKIVRAARR